MKYFILAGEGSGDLLGGKLIEELQKIDQKADFRFWGGDSMAFAAAGKPLTHIKDLAFMGFVEVLKNIITIVDLLKNAKQDITNFKPDAVVLIDYPGFNLRMAKWCHQQGYQVIYYVSPTVWAWHESRAKTIKLNVDLMICLFPFEVEFYKKYKVNAVYRGNPVVERIHQVVKDEDFLLSYNIGKKVLALVPGSRMQEVKKILPIMVKAAKLFEKEYEIIISKVSHLPLSIYKDVLKENHSQYHIIENKYEQILSHASLAVVTSGTASLETALFGVPQVVCYKTSYMSYLLARILIKIKYISLVNIIADQALVKELIQDQCTPHTIVDELRKLKPNNKAMYEPMYLKMKGAGGGSKEIAREVWEYVSKSAIEI